MVLTWMVLLRRQGLRGNRTTITGIALVGPYGPKLVNESMLKNGRIDIEECLRPDDLELKDIYGGLEKIIREYPPISMEDFDNGGSMGSKTPRGGGGKTPKTPRGGGGLSSMIKTPRGGAFKRSLSTMKLAVSNQIGSVLRVSGEVQSRRST